MTEATIDSRIEGASRSRAEPTIRAVRPGDEPGVIDLLRTVHGSWPNVEAGSPSIDPVSFFRWKHERSPFGKSLVVVAEQDAELVGLRAFMPWVLSAAGRTLRALRPVDAATRPDLQRAGIFGRIRRELEAIFPEPADLHFGVPNDKSFGAVTKIGEGEAVGALCTSRLVRPATTILAALGSNSDGPLAVDAPPVGQVLDGQPEIAELVDEAQAAEERLATAKDLVYLRWRYGDAPLDYRAVCDSRRGKLRAIGIFRACVHRGVWEAVIEELIVRPGEPRATARVLREIARSAAFGLLRCRFANGGAQRSAALRLGFVSQRTGHPLLVGSIRPGITPSPDRLDSWALSLGDVDLL